MIYKYSKLYFLFSLLFIGCALNQKIKYSLKDIDPSPNKSLQETSLSIEYLEDARKSVTDNEILFKNGRMTGFQGRKVYVNSEEHYKNPSVTNQVSTVIAEHINKRASFKTVMVSSKTITDFYLSGKLNTLYGCQDYSTGAAVGAQFGLIGALATSGIKTDGTIIIWFSDLKIFTKDDKLVKDIGEINETYSEQFPVDAYGWCIYTNVNTKLKEVVSKLSKKIEETIAEYVSIK